MAEHNHVTTVVKPRGECPACDLQRKGAAARGRMKPLCMFTAEEIAKCPTEQHKGYECIDDSQYPLARALTQVQEAIFELGLAQEDPPPTEHWVGINVGMAKRRLEKAERLLRYIWDNDGNVSRSRSAHFNGWLKRHG